MKMFQAKPFKLSIANQWHEGEAMPPEAFVPPNQPYKFAVRLKNEAGQIIGSQMLMDGDWIVTNEFGEVSVISDIHFTQNFEEIE